MSPYCNCMYGINDPRCCAYNAVRVNDLYSDPTARAAVVRALGWLEDVIDARGHLSEDEMLEAESPGSSEASRLLCARNELRAALGRWK